eukprot:c3680_g1_i1.p1 GENE.c3680_g1_i1~~c3680_g1_i1.p1  ORF type:complete len:277 (+),score=-23.61 c3680_g1_i1:115-945(+)
MGNILNTSNANEGIGESNRAIKEEGKGDGETKSSVTLIKNEGVEGGEREKTNLPHLSSETEKAEDVNRVKVRKLELPWMTTKYYACVVEGLFTKKQCDELIAASESRGYETALVNIGYGAQEKMLDVRNSERCIIDSFQMAKDLMDRLYPYLPHEFQGKKISCVNERMRFLKYEPGGYFRPHMDGVYSREGQTSKVTIQIYLNEGFRGGSTRFLNQTYNGMLETVDVVPKIGDVLLFQHRLLHEGEQLYEGIKYTIRTDVMYALDEENEYKPPVTK